MSSSTNLAKGIPVTLANAAEWPDVARKLNEPFAAGCVGWKPGRVSGQRAVALAYIDARDVMDRLDAVLGPGNWRDEYEVLPNGAVRCRLSVRVGGEWLAKEDAGGASDQPDAGDRMKAAFSDALKRVAVKFGIGRYLYHLEAAWVDYDPHKKQFRGTPTLPAWALPGGSGRPAAYAQPAWAAPAPDEPAPQQKPANDRAAALKREKDRTQTPWARCVAWINETGNTAYPADVKYGDLAGADVDALIAHLRTLPAAQPAKKQPAGV